MTLFVIIVNFCTVTGTSKKNKSGLSDNFSEKSALVALQAPEVERAELMPLPLFRYEFKKQQILTVMKNGHICLSADKHY